MRRRAEGHDHRTELERRAGGDQHRDVARRALDDRALQRRRSGVADEQVDALLRRQPHDVVAWRRRRERGGARGHAAIAQPLTPLRQLGRGAAQLVRADDSGDDQLARWSRRRQRLGDPQQPLEPVERLRHHQHRPLRHRGRRRRHARPRRRRREVERRVLLEDRVLELLEAGARLEPQLVRQHAPRAAVGLERLSLARRAVQRQHQLAPQPLAQRVLGHQRLELTDEPRMAPRGQLGVHARLEGLEPQLLDAGDLGLRERLIGEVAERRAAPQIQRLTQLARRPLGVGHARLADQAFEACHVKLGAVDAQDVARRTRHQAALPEHLAQPRHVELDALGRGRRRRRAPEIVEQAVDRDDLVGVQQKHRQQRPLLPAADHQHAIALEHLQWAQKPEFHGGMRRVSPTLPRRIYRRLPLRTLRVDRAGAQSRAQTATGGHNEKGSRPCPALASPAPSASASRSPPSAPRPPQRSRSTARCMMRSPPVGRPPSTPPTMCARPTRCPRASRRPPSRSPTCAPRTPATTARVAAPSARRRSPWSSSSNRRPPRSGFDWGDAGLGAGGLVGLILLGLGGTAVVAHRKAHPRGTATT